MTAKYTISDPRLVDYRIQQLQIKFSENLFDEKTYNSYGRVQIIDDIPKVYIGNNEYKDLLLNDKVNAHSFFMIDENSNYEGFFTHDVSIVFMVDLGEVYAADRGADMKAVDEVCQLLREEPYSFQMEDVKFSPDIDIEITDNMRPFFMFQINGTMNYELNC